MHVHENANQGCTELGARRAPNVHPCYTHAHTINITTAIAFLRPPSAISQTSQSPSSWNDLHAILQQNIKACTHTHTHNMQPLCTHFTLYTHMHTLIKGVLNQGQSPQRTPLLHAHLHLHIHTHMHAHTANITTPTVLVHHSLPSSRSWSPPISTVREENTQKKLVSCKKIKHCCTLYRLSICTCTHTHAHTANITTPTVLVHHSLLSSRS